MGVGCDEAGKCYASAQGKPEMCAAPTPTPAAAVLLPAENAGTDLENALHHLAVLGAVDRSMVANWASLNPGGVGRLIEALIGTLPINLKDYYRIIKVTNTSGGRNDN